MYLESAFERNFVQGKYNHIVQDLYKNLVGSVRFEADTLTITGTHIILSKAGIPVTQLYIGSHEQSGAQLSPSQRRHWMSFRQAMRVIIKHDPGVRRYATLAEETPEAVIYHLSIVSEE